MNKFMNQLLTEQEIHAFGIHILIKKLEEDGWIIESADPAADRATHPQIIGHNNGEIGFFVVRTAVYPGKGRIEGEEVFQNQVRHADKHGAVCYFASLGIASEGESEEAKSSAVKGGHYHVSFDGLVKMAMPESQANGA